MGNSKDRKDQIREFANETLSAFDVIAQKATIGLAERQNPVSSEAFAYINTHTNTEALRSQKKIHNEIVASYQLLRKEPAIARVVVCKENGKRRVYYICRNTSVEVPNIKLASYNAPIGRLASLPVGAECTIPTGSKDLSFEILESAKLYPEFNGDGWDSKNTEIEGNDYTYTVQSLRSFKRTTSPDSALLDQSLEEEKESADILEGRRRHIIDKMELRDQPVLDRYQDEIFRLPLNSRLLILGAPGTGKTTTLIRRLGQKLDLNNGLDESETQIVMKLSESSREHKESWVMFTPTELLRQYVKEAFARADIAAPDERICTWDDFRRQLAKNKFGILKSSSGGGSFVIREKTKTLLPETIECQTLWFDDFDGWQQELFWNELGDAAKQLADNSVEKIAKLGTQIMSLMGKDGKVFSLTTLVALHDIRKEIQAQRSKMKEATDEHIKRSLVPRVNDDQQFLDNLATFLDSLEEVNNEDSEDSEQEEDDESPQSTRLADARTAYFRAARSQARSATTKRRIGKATRMGRLIEWLNGQLLAEDSLIEIGQSLVVQSYLQRFTNPVQRFVNGIPSRYRRFRRVRQNEEKWYLSKGYTRKDIHPLEIDVILLALLRSADALIQKIAPSNRSSVEAIHVLNRQQELYRNQILVDEATDFSPLQLGCMASLAHPQIRSFFACGDFNQRITSFGTRSMKEMSWVLRDIESKKVTIAYRQSKQLHELAKQIVAQSSDDANDAEPSNFLESVNPPILATNLSLQKEIVGWLAQRIVEIEKFVKKLPSIAILVNDEHKVSSIATALNEELEEQNIQVKACPEGQVMGLESDVRVFDVQYIKGLEFEAVFFVGIDQLAKKHPDLFDKYLYVGATRAATYLGITCESDLPAKIKKLEPMFENSWIDCKKPA